MIEHSGEPHLDRQAIREAMREEIRAYWSVLLPSPEVLAQYDEIAPGAAERILCMAEQSVKAKLDREDKLARAQIASARRRLRVTFSVVFLAFTAAAVSFALRYQVAGIAFVALSLAAFIRSFIYAVR